MRPVEDPEAPPAPVVERLADLPGGWRLERARGRAGVLHAADLPAGRVVRICEATDPVVVLGSAQRESVLDRRATAAEGWSVVRRRSGGGAVVLRPTDHVWVDVAIPVGDRLWDDDVERSSWWVGEWWVAALGVPATVHRAPVSDRRSGSVACFAAVGPGEVVSPEGRKLVGISQRRSRLGARFQTLSYRLWDPGILPGLLADREAASWVEPLLRERVGAVPDTGGLVARLAAGVPP